LRFIDQLRQQAEAERAAWKERSRQLEDAERERLSAHQLAVSRAREFAEQSGIIQAAIELAEVLHGWSETWNVGERNPYVPSSGDSDKCVCKVTWSGNVYKKPRREFIDQNSVIVRVDPAGTISIEADAGASISIGAERWRPDRSILEAALEEAYKNPHRTPFLYWPYSHESGFKGV
jgi:hypothetical protein